MPRPTRLISLAILVAAVILTGCAQKKDPSAVPTAVTTLGQASPTLEPTKSPPKPPVVTTSPPIIGDPVYPNDHETYAKVAIAAWKAHKLDRLGDLTTAQVHEQIIEIPAPNMNWTFDMCDGVAGAQYCSFNNNDGNKITLKVTSQYLSQAHAITQVLWED